MPAQVVHTLQFTGGSGTGPVSVLYNVSHSEPVQLGALPYVTPHVTVRPLEGTSVILMERSECSLGNSEPEIRGFFEGLCDVFDKLQTDRLDLLVDARRGPGRNDQLFEQLQSEYRSRIFDRFRRTAVVIKTYAGKLQVARYETQDTKLRFALFESLSEALAHLEEAA